MTTKVVNVKTDEFDVYIGRAVNRAKDPRCHRKSVFASPFKLGKDGTREDVVAKYATLWQERLAGNERDEWIDRLKKLKGKRLGCWCKPQPCHGDVLVKLISELC